MTGLHEGRGASLAVLLHGWGGDETSMAVFETAFGPGWRTVRLRAPYPLPGGGYAWWIPQADGRPDPRMVQESLRALRGWMEELLHREARGASHRVVVGFSQGGAMAALLALQAPDLVTGLAVFSGFLPDVPEAGAAPSLVGKAVFIAHGRADPLVPIAQGRALCARFQALGARTTCVEYPGGHKAGAEAWRAFREWIRGLKEF
jgi:phospholipase/carboxylesterase